MIWYILIGWLIIVLLVVAWIRRKPDDYAHNFIDCVIKLYASPIALLFFIAGAWWAFFLDSFKQGMKSHES